MPTVFSHIAFPVAAAVAMGRARVSTSMLLVGMLATVVPDFDGIAFKLGIPYGGMWGHRGFTHTIGFALAMGLFGLLLARRWQLPKWKAFAWIALCTFSHPVADTLTNGGIAIPLYWPTTETRFFSPWTPVEVSPIALKRFFAERGAVVIWSEIKVLWIPLMSAAMVFFAWRNWFARKPVQAVL
jgi:inner membrane protein